MVFGTPVPWEDTLRFLFLKQNPFVGGIIAQLSLTKYYSSEFRTTKPSEPKYLTAAELKDPMQAPPGNGEPGERLRPHGHLINCGSLLYPIAIHLPGSAVIA
jgi:hypothetical protein